MLTDKFFNILSENHLVFYELGKNKNAGEFEILSTDGSDVSLTTPFIIYNAPLNRWEVWGGFHFSNDSAWWGERPNCGGFCNPDGNIGKSDMLGVYLSGGTNGASLVEMWMQPIHSDAPSPYNGGYDGNYATRINYRSGTYSSELGGMFTAQDAVVAHGLGSDGYAKYSNNFGKGAVKLSYTSSFSGASGNATSAYLHTWSSAEISSISVSTSGVSVSVINASNSTGVLSSLDYAY